MKKLTLLLITLTILSSNAFAQNYDFNFPLIGESIANDKLQYDVVKKIYRDTAKIYPACTSFKVKNTQIVHYPYDVEKKKGKYVSGYWKELWSIKACDKTIQIPITFYINKKKTTFIYDKTVL